MVAAKHKVSGVWRTGIPQRKGKKLPSKIGQQVSSEGKMSMSDVAMKAAEDDALAAYESGVDHAFETANARALLLEEALLAALAFIEDQSDVIDGDYGEPAPNRAMQLASEIKEVLEPQRDGRIYAAVSRASNPQKHREDTAAALASSREVRS